MQDETGNKQAERKELPDSHIPDPFGDYMRRRLENHRVPMDDAGWETMEARIRQEGLDKAASSFRPEGSNEATLSSQPKGSNDAASSPQPKRSVAGWRLLLWTAAAVLAALVWLSPFSRKERIAERTVRKTQVEKGTAPEVRPLADAVPKQQKQTEEDIQTPLQPFRPSGRDRKPATDHGGPAKKAAASMGTEAIPTDHAVALGEAGATLTEEAIGFSETEANRADETIALAPTEADRTDKAPVVAEIADASRAGKATDRSKASVGFSEPSIDLAGKDSTTASPAAPSSRPQPSADRRSLAVRQSLAGKTYSAASQRQRSSHWLLAARAGTEGNLSLPQGMNMYDASSPSQDGSVSDPPFTDETGPRPPSDPSLPGSSLSDVFVPENFSEADYLPPLSFGLIVRKNLTSRLGVETGLVYMFLASRFVNRGMIRQEARSELHYLGIPLRLVVYLWDRSRWNVYFTAGGMVEKGLRSSYSFTEYKNYQALTVHRKETIHGLQWSLNASIGVSYRLFRSWSLYLEPQFSYYFDSGQPASIRTDKPLGIGFGGGVRYAF